MLRVGELGAISLALGKHPSSALARQLLPANQDKAIS
jgi:hypothetical protein